MKRILILALSLVVILSFVLSGCSNSTPTTTPPQTTQPATTTPVSSPTATTPAPTSTETIKLGIALPQSGAFAASAPYQLGVSQMRVDEINAAGGLLGRKLELVIRDNAGDPSLMPQVLSQLKQAGCVSIFGIIGGADLVDFQWATQNKIPVFGSNGDNIERTKEFSKYGFYVGPMDLGLTIGGAPSSGYSEDLRRFVDVQK
jgi:ABC-type branched-subunit amino acid transport system substrate-binding protein